MMDIDQAEKIYKLLANKRRIAIIKFIYKEKEVSVSEIAGHINLSIKATSKHLQLLYSGNIIKPKQKSLYMIYAIKEPLNPIIKNMLKIL